MGSGSRWCLHQQPLGCSSCPSSRVRLAVRRANSDNWNNRAVVGANTNEIRIPLSEFDPGQAYVAKVRASKGPNGNRQFSDYSNEARFNVPDPNLLATPTGFTVTLTATHAVFRYNDNATGEENYRLAVRRANSDNWNNRAVVGANTNEIRIPLSEFDPGQAYVAKVRASKGPNGNRQFSDYSNEARFNVPDPNLLATPTGFTVTLTATHAVFRYNDNATGEENYRLAVRRANSDNWNNRAVVGANTNEIRIPLSEFDPGQAYVAKVRASKGPNGNRQFSDYSNEARFNVPDPNLLATPTGFTVTLTATHAVFRYNDNATGEENYRLAVRRANSDNWNNRAVVGANTNEIRIPLSEFDPGQAYVAKVRASKGPNGNRQFSDYSNEAGFTVPNGLDAPSHLAVRVTNRFVIFTYHDNATREENYRLAVRRGNSNDWNNKAVVGANTTEIRVPISEFRKGTTYFAKVRASVGPRGSREFSDYSGEVSFRI